MSKHTNFVAACRRIEAAIVTATQNGSGAHKAKAAMLKDLALWATTSSAASEFPRLKKLKLPWKLWDEEMFWPGLLVAATLRMMDVDDVSAAKARSYIRVPAADLAEAFRLLKQAGLRACV